MKRFGRIWWLGLVLFLIVLPAAVQAMPLHPDLLDRIARGELILPEGLDTAAMRPPWEGPDYSDGNPSPLTGTVRFLVVLVDFSDKVKTAPTTFFDDLIFAAPGSGKVSVRDYYNKVSYGQVDIVTVNLPSALGWNRAPQNYSYYVNNAYGLGTYPNNCQKMAEDVVDAIASVVDFSQYVIPGTSEIYPITIIHAGSGREKTGLVTDIHSHAWTLKYPRTYNGVVIKKYNTEPEYWYTASATNSDMTIGVYAHEMGHSFWNLPDLYDRNNTSEGIGYWSLMAAGSWNGPSPGGGSPAWPDAWSRIQMGFVTPTVISGNVTGKSIPQVANNPSAQTVLKLTSTVLGPSEYFLVENRQTVSNCYDTLPGNGLLIWHVDEAQWSYSIQNDYPCTQVTPCNCATGQHYLVALEQADNLLELEKKTNRGNAGDPYPGSSNKRSWTFATQPGSGSWYNCNDTKLSITNISDSGATMTADIQIESPAVTLQQALDNATLNFTTGGDSGKVWLGETTTWHYGGSAAQSGSIADNQSSWLQTTVVGPGTLSFYFKVSSEIGYDWLRWYLDGIKITGWSGNKDWSLGTINVPAGTHIIKWQYEKDGSAMAGSDCGWVDQVVYTGGKCKITSILPLLLD
jgi:M6 family metalloprotease-like protein